MLLDGNCSGAFSNEKAILFSDKLVETKKKKGKSEY